MSEFKERVAETIDGYFIRIHQQCCRCISTYPAIPFLLDTGKSQILWELIDVYKQYFSFLVTLPRYKLSKILMSSKNKHELQNLLQIVLAGDHSTAFCRGERSMLRIFCGSCVKIGKII
eukprot:TRINITY_DN13846_c0_g1_i1.p1 TRINITY_DN13846_c0_g1~~TRINITY_DN13846_c0_g1_i1.p1  ORF type:complete len:119 (-),score=6.44 TRINITY_DN13846_c0_g1_i1:443-799(-)